MRASATQAPYDAGGGQQARGEQDLVCEHGMAGLILWMALLVTRWDGPCCLFGEHAYRAASERLPKDQLFHALLVATQKEMTIITVADAEA